MVLPRPVRLVGTEAFADARLRVWEMRAGDDWPPGRVHAAARPLVAPFAAGVGGRAGFLLVHAARPAFFVLAHVWHGVDLHQRTWTAPLDAPDALVPLRSGSIGCVWELEVVAAERARWAAVCDLDDAVGRYLADE